MAPGGSRPRCSPCRNLFPLDPVEDELAREPGPVGGPHSSSTSLALSRNSTLGPKLVPALNPAPVPAPAPPSSDELFKQFMRAHLELNKDLDSLQQSASNPLRLRYQRCTMVSHTWTAITSASSAKIILRLLGPLGTTGLPLQLFSSAGTLVSAGRSTNGATKVRN